mgnify:CR=1 FL=1
MTKDRTQKIRIGLIGLGNMGRNHLRVLSIMKGVEIAFIYDQDPAKTKEACSIYDVNSSKDLNSSLSDVDAVIICTPTVTHSDMLRTVGKMVKNIFIEKPLSNNLNNSMADVDYISKAQLSVQVGFIERFNPVIVQLQKVLNAGNSIVNLDLTRTNNLSSRITDVDVISDLMIHDIDLAIFINGPVSNVFSSGYVENGMIALATANLEHANGSFSRIHASRITNKKIRRLQVTCLDSFIDCELVRKELIINKQSKIDQVKNDMYTISGEEHIIEVPQQEALMSELLAFVEMCKSGHASGPDEKDGLNAEIICSKIRDGIGKWA